MKEGLPIPDQKNPILLEPPVSKLTARRYPWLGLVLGTVIGLLIIHPISMLVRDIHDTIYAGASLHLGFSLIHSFHLQMWPMAVLYTVLGAIVGVILGIVEKHLKEHRIRLDNLHQEFELQVATLRHHYKNLALGIHGFAKRAKKKMADLDEEFRQRAESSPEYAPLQQEFQALERNVVVLEEASERLTETLSQELLFLKALTSDSLITASRDFYPVIIHAAKDLLDLRFRDKEIRVEINDRDLEKCHDSLIFHFEPYTMEVILQNLLSNAMKFGNHIQMYVREEDHWVKVEIRDNGPGLDVEKLQNHLLAPADRQKLDSTHLGLKVSLHLIIRSGGRLWVDSLPGRGSTFIVDFPKEPSGKY